MTRDELTQMIAETVDQLTAKIKGAILDDKPDNAVRWAEALRDATLAYAEITDLPTDDD